MLLSLFSFWIISLLFIYTIYIIIIVPKRMFDKMFYSKVYRIIEEWTFPVVMPFYDPPIWVLTVCTFIGSLLPAIIANAFCDYCDPILEVIGPIEATEKTTKTVETTRFEPTYRSARIVHTSSNLTIHESSGIEPFSAPRYDIIRYRVPLKTLPISKQVQVEHGSSDYEEPTIFFHDEELDQNQKYAKGKEQKETGALWPSARQTISHAEGSDSNDRYGGYGNGRHETMYTLQVLSMAKTIQLRGVQRGKVADSRQLQQRGIRTRRILFTYDTGSFLLTAPSKLRNEIYSLAAEEEVIGWKTVAKADKGKGKMEHDKLENVRTLLYFGYRDVVNGAVLTVIGDHYPSIRAVGRDRR